MKLKKLLAAATAVLMLSAVVFTVNADSENASAADEPPSQSVTETTQNELGEEEADEPSQEESDNTYADNAGNDDDTGDSETGDVIDNSEIGEEGSQDDTAVISDNDGIALMSGDIVAEINEANFPDENFRNFISTYDNNPNDNMLSPEEISDVTSISLSDSNISDVTGIKYFTNLRYLSISSTKITELDLENCSSLTFLSCGYNRYLKSLNVKGCTSLSTIQFYSTQLTSLDLSECSDSVSLTYNMYGGSNTFQIAMAKLDGAGQKLISELEQYGFDPAKASDWSGAVYENGVLTITDRTVTYTYDCGNGKTYTPIIELLIPVNEETFPDEIFRNHIIAYVANYNSNDTIENAISPVEIINNQSAHSFTIRGSEGVSDLTGIEYFSDVLTYLELSNTTVTSLDLSGFTALEKVQIYGSSATVRIPITSINFSGCSSLNSIRMEYANLTNIDLSGCTALKELYLQYNQLTEIDLSDCTLLEKLNLEYNKFSSLDLGNLTSLKTADLQGNDLTSVTVAPGVTSLGLSKDPVVFLGCVTGEDNLRVKINAYDPNFKFEKAAIFEGANVSYDKVTDKLTINDYGQNSGDLSFKYTYDTGVSSIGTTISELTATFKFTIAGELTVSNTVAGNAANLNDGFTFTIDLGDESINETYSYMYSENDEYKYVETEFTNGIATFILKNGESRNVELPAGYKYTVTESGYGDYVVSCNGNVGDNDSGNIIKFDTALAAFTNEKNKNEEPEVTPTPPVNDPLNPDDPAPSDSYNPDNSNNSNYYGEEEDMSSAAGIYEEGEQLEIASYAGTAATIIIVPVIIIPAIILKKRYKIGR